MQTVHINAWRSDKDKGFNLYLQPKAADYAFEYEKQNCKLNIYASEHHKAYRFDFEADESLTLEQLKKLIDSQFDELCEHADLKFEE